MLEKYPFSDKDKLKVNKTSMMLYCIFEVGFVIEC